MALGNAYEALADDLDSFNYNPAGLSHLERFTLRLTPIQARVSKDLVDETAELPDLLSDLDELSGLPEDQVVDHPAAQRLVDRIARLRRRDLALQSDFVVLSLGAPLFEVAQTPITAGVNVTNRAFSWFRFRRAGLPWRSVVLDTLDDRVQWSGALEVATIQAAVAAKRHVELPFVRTVRAGLGWRWVNRKYRNDQFEIAEALHPERFQEEHLRFGADQEVSSFQDVLDLVDENTETTRGFGVDLGLQAEHTDYLRSALVVRSLVSNVGEGRFPRTLTVGLAARPLRALNRENDLLDLQVAAALSSPAGDNHLEEFRNNSFTDYLHLGIEAVLLPRSPLRLAVRAGNNHGYPTFGLEVALAFLKAGVAYYGDLETDWWTGGVTLDF